MARERREIPLFTAMFAYIFGGAVSSLDGRPNGIFMPYLLYHAAACNGIPLHGFGPAGWRIDLPAESSLEGSWER